jgi:hypothetical protein
VKGTHSCSQRCLFLRYLLLFIANGQDKQSYKRSRKSPSPLNLPCHYRTSMDRKDSCEPWAPELLNNV